MKKRAIILGAGRPARGVLPSALHNLWDDVGRGRVLDWLLDALGAVCEDILFVGGYRIQDVIEAYPGIRVALNPEWEASSTVASLLRASLDDRSGYIISYSDVLFRSHHVRQLDAKGGEVVIGVDSLWKGRYSQRSTVDIRHSEAVVLGPRGVIKVFSPQDLERPGNPDGEFIGLMKIGPRAAGILKVLAASEDLGGWGLPRLINHFIQVGLPVTCMDVQGDWAELNAPQDLSHFIMGTKAETLSRLRPMVKASIIGDQVTFTVGEWKQNPEFCLDIIARSFPEGYLAVRSSALDEDGFSNSNAGRFESALDIPALDRDALRRSIAGVVASYASPDGRHQILIQKMISDVALSGVALTRTLSCGAPYFVLNYDDSTGSTRSVTGGTNADQKTVILHRLAEVLPPGVPDRLRGLLRALKELEGLVGHDSLDVEFIIDRHGIVHIVQLRPITVDHTQWQGTDDAIARALADAQAEFSRLQTPSPFVLGKRTIFGVMPDWNPAEIIGKRPRRLARSLYASLVTDTVWARQRDEFGYRRVMPQPLMHCFAGHPYIDVRASLNSFIPKGVGDGLAARLVDHYLGRLEANPDLHDKLEFKIAFTCRTLDFLAQAERLEVGGFTAVEIDELGTALSTLTNQAFARIQADLEGLEYFSRRFQPMANAPLDPLRKAVLLLEDCRSLGTLNFAHLARAGFIAVILLNSAVSIGAITEKEKLAFQYSLQSVTRQYTRDLAGVRASRIDLVEFLEVYGHLRPGTYDITVPSYRHAPEHYSLGPRGQEVESRHGEPPPFLWRPEAMDAISRALAANGLDLDFPRFEAYLQAAIEGRELSKFTFSRNVSLALDLLGEYARGLGLSQEDLAHVSIQDLGLLAGGQVVECPGTWLRQRVQEGRYEHELAQGIELPPLLLSAVDFLAFVTPSSEPNFVGMGRVSGPPCFLDGDGDPPEDLDGKILFIPSADPGFDWIFGFSLLGLVTAFGGANSHMAIRAAELNLPAAIGVGEDAFNRLRRACHVTLDCTGRRLSPL